jgi:hypothetical protein
VLLTMLAYGLRSRAEPNDVVPLHASVGDAAWPNNPVPPAAAANPRWNEVEAAAQSRWGQSALPRVPPRSGRPEPPPAPVDPPPDPLDPPPHGGIAGQPRYPGRY